MREKISLYWSCDTVHWDASSQLEKTDLAYQMPRTMLLFVILMQLSRWMECYPYSTSTEIIWYLLCYDQTCLVRAGKMAQLGTSLLCKTEDINTDLKNSHKKVGVGRWRNDSMSKSTLPEDLHAHVDWKESSAQLPLLTSTTWCTHTLKQNTHIHNIRLIN